MPEIYEIIKAHTARRLADHSKYNPFHGTFANIYPNGDSKDFIEREVADEIQEKARIGLYALVMCVDGLKKEYGPVLEALRDLGYLVRVEPTAPDGGKKYVSLYINWEG